MAPDGPCCARAGQRGRFKYRNRPAAENLKMLTTNGYAVSNIENERGRLKPGFAADIIAVPGNPLEDIDALRDVQFVMKDGTVFKRDGIVTPESFFHGVPVNGWRIREESPRR